MGEQRVTLSRRTLLRGSAMAVFAGMGWRGSIAVALDGPGFLTASELSTLRAVVDRIVPGRPEDPAEGARFAQCAEAIDGLLAAFASDPPRIYAGAPFSDRGGNPTDDFLDFLPLDEYETRAWRLRIEGSAGQREREFNGEVPGFQTIYREGLAALDTAAGPVRFASLPGPARDVLLKSTNDEKVRRLVDVAVPHTLEFFYGAPEYGGNRDLVSWAFTNYDGDVQPRGWTDAEVTEPGSPGSLPPLPPGIDRDDLIALAPFAAPEVLAGMLQRADGSLQALQDEVSALLEAARAR